MQIASHPGLQIGGDIKQFNGKNLQENYSQMLSNSKGISKQQEYKAISSISKIDFNTAQKQNKVNLIKTNKSVSHSNIGESKNKRKIVIIQEVFSQKQTKSINQKSKSDANSCKQLQRAPSLKKITRFILSHSQSFPNQNDEGLQDSNSSCVKRVKFGQNIGESEQQSKNNSIQIEQTIRLNKFYQKIKGYQKKKQSNNESFMHFLCSILSLNSFLNKRNNNKIQKKVMGLNDLKITGTREQIQLLKSIGRFFLIDQLQIQCKQWKKLGFKSQKPLKQLENAGVLVILQWKNFIVSNQQLSRKLFNFFIQMEVSLTKFHQKITQVYCKQIQSCKISGSSWQQYQSLYNQLVINSSYCIFQKCQNKPSQIQKAITEIVENCGKKLKINNKIANKKISVKIPKK